MIKVKDDFSYPGLNTHISAEIKSAIELRRRTPVDQRARLSTPGVTDTHMRAALWWSILVLRQDKPLLLFAGTLALALQIPWLIYKAFS